MKSPFADARMFHRGQQNGMREELAVLDHQVDAGDVHMYDATGPDVEMSDLAVAHLSLGQSDERSAGVDERVRIFAQQTVVGRLARERNGVGLGLGAVPPAVEDDEDEWFRTRHF